MDNAIGYTFYKHKEDGVFDKEGWGTMSPGRYMRSRAEGIQCMTKLNRLMLMKLFKLDQEMHDWVLANLPGATAWDVDAHVGSSIQGAIKLIRKGGTTPEEKERMAKRRRDEEPMKIAPCRDWPRCKRDKRCKYMHARR